jgi:hypothetical protein
MTPRATTIERISVRPSAGGPDRPHHARPLFDGGMHLPPLADRRRLAAHPEDVSARSPTPGRTRSRSPREAGSSLAGQAVGPGIILGFLDAHEPGARDRRERKLVRMEPGAIHSRVQRAVAPHGLRLGPDPSSGDFCTIGGNVGTNAAGAQSLRMARPRTTWSPSRWRSTTERIVDLAKAPRAEAGAGAASGRADRDPAPRRAALPSRARRREQELLRVRPVGAWDPGDAVSSIGPGSIRSASSWARRERWAWSRRSRCASCRAPRPRPSRSSISRSWIDAVEAVLEARRLGASAVEAMDYTFLASCGSTARSPRPGARTLRGGILVEFEGASDTEARTGLARARGWVAPGARA